MVRGLLGGLLGGAIGAGLWVTIGALTGFEAGWFAWGTGILVGLGAALGAGQDRSRVTAAFAGLVALLACVGARYMTLRQAVRDHIATQTARIASIGEEDVKRGIADEVLAEFQTLGRNLTWAAAADSDSAWAAPMYPDPVCAEAQRRWNLLAPAQRADGEESCRQAVRRELADRAALLRAGGFLWSLTAIDLVWLGLAVATACRIGGEPAKARPAPAGEDRDETIEDPRSMAA